MMNNNDKNCSIFVRLLLAEIILLIWNLSIAEDSSNIVDSETIVEELLNGHGSTRGIGVQPRVLDEQNPGSKPIANTNKPTKVTPNSFTEVTSENVEVQIPNSISLNIQFQFGSALLTQQAQLQLIELGEALSSSALSHYNFEIGGHTDSIGKASYNKWLSEQRAIAVKYYLENNFHLNQNQLLARGYGEDKPLLTSDPANGINRRVEIRAFTN